MGRKARRLPQPVVLEPGCSVQTARPAPSCLREGGGSGFERAGGGRDRLSPLAPIPARLGGGWASRGAPPAAPDGRGGVCARHSESPVRQASCREYRRSPYLPANNPFQNVLWRRVPPNYTPPRPPSPECSLNFPPSFSPPFPREDKRCTKPLGWRGGAVLGAKPPFWGVGVSGCRASHQALPLCPSVPPAAHDGGKGGRRDPVPAAALRPW